MGLIVPAAQIIAEARRIGGPGSGTPGRRAVLDRTHVVRAVQDGFAPDTEPDDGNLMPLIDLDLHELTNHRPPPAADLTREPAPTVADLLAQADASTSPRVTAAARAVRGTVDLLRDALRNADAEQAATARVDELRRLLADAEREAASFTAPVEPAAKYTRPVRALGRQLPPVDNKAVRAWASEHNIPCPDRGRVPASVVDAYNARDKS